jgi:hypothetical protein
MITGDRLWVERGARAELQLGSAAVRVGGATSLTLLNLDDRTAQVQLSQGTLNIRVRRLDRGQVFEVDTPNLAFSIRRPGRYRINVDADGDATMVTVRSGQAEVYGPGRAFVVGERLSYRFYDTGLRDYETFALLPVDEFERWSGERDRRWDSSVSRRYVSPELIGAEQVAERRTAQAMRKVKLAPRIRLDERREQADAQEQRDPGSANEGEAIAAEAAEPSVVARSGHGVLSHRHGERMVDVCGNDHAPARNLVTNQFGGKLLAVRDIPHFLGDYTIAGVTHLREIAVSIFGFAVCDPL